MDVEKLKYLRESEDNVEFKEAKGGNYSFNGGSYPDPAKRRRCILGYVTALANEGGGYLVFGVKDKYPHEIVGSKQNEGSVGQLKSKIYNQTGIRVHAAELFDKNNKRVLVIEVPSRPVGKAYKFEDVPLMRIGEELKPMADQMYFKILQEQEPDFSQQICKGVKIKDLDKDAIQVLKQKYARKQNNSQFLSLKDEQILSDLDLISGNRVTNAAVILLGKEEILKQKLPQASIMLEYRQTDHQINFDQRFKFQGPYFLIIEKLWETVNIRNGSFPIQNGPYIFDIPYFNQEVIREAINNAIAHRDYNKTSETVIKQYPTRLEISNPGGFPVGVELSNILIVPSTPRNRLLADVLQKTGIVERSGQGIDKIFYQTLSEGKQVPDYSESDDFHVNLKLSSVIEDKAFALFIESVQTEYKDDEKLSVFEIIALNKIKKGLSKNEINPKMLDRLIKRGLVEKKGKTKGVKYILTREYYEFIDEKASYSKETDWDDKQAFLIILQHLQKFEKAKMKDFVELFEGRLTRKQVRYIVEKLVERKDLEKEGQGKGTTYTIGKNFIESMDILSKAVDIGLKQMRENGELDDEN
ncbi:MAG: ATP-binding protein [Bacteroidota bacterium]